MNDLMESGRSIGLAIHNHPTLLFCPSIEAKVLVDFLSNFRKSWRETIPHKSINTSGDMIWYS